MTPLPQRWRLSLVPNQNYCGWCEGGVTLFARTEAELAWKCAWALGVLNYHTREALHIERIHL